MTIKIHKVENSELKELLKERGSIIEKGREISQKIEDLENERNALGLQVQKVKDKIKPIVEYIMDPMLAEFEMYTVSRLNAEGEVEIEYIDQVEQFKEILREKKEKGIGSQKEEEEQAKVDNSANQTNESSTN